MSLVYLVLGGNQGNRTEIFSKAIDLVTSEIGQKTAISSIYESESWGFESDLFINQVIAVKTLLSPEQVLSIAQHIENRLGRMRKSNGYEARTLDIDLLYYDDIVVENEILTLPHPRIPNRRFVLVPMAEIAPSHEDPLTGLSIKEMLQNCTDLSKVWPLGQNPLNQKCV
jgi:2-amino-4-hydroxy-6-hydroxymethyldihydropteridine diphosphokinase